jgi:hypothetical protein
MSKKSVKKALLLVATVCRSAADLVSQSYNLVLGGHGPILQTQAGGLHGAQYLNGFKVSLGRRSKSSGCKISTPWGRQSLGENLSGNNRIGVTEFGF